MVDVEVRRDESVRVEYADGEVATFPVEALRAACPCATCRGMRERGGTPWPPAGGPATISVVDAQFAGAWGLQLRWSDGHSTGIYSWTVLRRWWDAHLDAPLGIDPDPATSPGSRPEPTAGPG